MEIWGSEETQNFLTQQMMFKKGYGPNGEIYKIEPTTKVFNIIEYKKREWDDREIYPKKEINVDKKIFNKNKL